MNGRGRIVAAALLGLVRGQSCYYAPNQLAHENYIPCQGSSSSFSSCCLAGDYCLEEGACYNPGTQQTYVVGCTDPSYQDASCAAKNCQWGTQCRSLTVCSGSWYCCRPGNGLGDFPDDNSGPCGCDLQLVLAIADSTSIPAVTLLPTSFPTSTYSSAARSSTSAATSSTPASSSSSVSSEGSGTASASTGASTSKPGANSNSGATVQSNTDNSSSTLKLGLGVGIGLGLALIILAVAVTVFDVAISARRDQSIARALSRTGPLSEQNAIPNPIRTRLHRINATRPGTPTKSELQRHIIYRVAHRLTVAS